VFAKLDQKQDEIFGEPSWKKQPQPSRSTSM